MSGADEYGAIDRLVHRLAFSSRMIQLTAADIEAGSCAKAYQGIEVSRPIFITSLPRAGTTLLLELMTRLPGIASHTYRDMPFVLAPVLWRRISGPFQKSAVGHERAHGDGMQVGFDSPEAFEEVLWKAFWPRRFRGPKIPLWSASDSRPEFEAFFRDHMRKIVALCVEEGTTQGRYISKNNANIARIGLLRRLFPDSCILVPFRDPIAHAGSMLRQHLRFQELHAASPFGKRYMADIGHFEFGALHRPIAFPGLPDPDHAPSPSTIDYWLTYWLAAFEYLLTKREDVTFVSYDRMCEGGASSLSTVEARIDVEPGRLVAASEGRLHAPRPYHVEEGTCDPNTLERVRLAHERLMTESVV